MKSTLKYGLPSMAVVGIACFLFFWQAYPYHLHHKEQTLLFMYSADVLKTYLEKPAVLSCLAGDFLTQFFHYRSGGAAVFSLLMLLLGGLGYETFRHWTGRWVAAGLGVLLVGWEVLRFCGVTYPLSSTVSLIGSFVLFILLRQAKGKWTYPIVGILLVVLGYWLFGYGLFIFLFFALLRAATERKYILWTCAMVAVGMLLPVVTANKYLMTTEQTFRYPATEWWNTPDFTVERLLGLDIESHRGNWDKVFETVHPDMRLSGATYYYNLVNATQGKLPDRLMYYYQPAVVGLFIPVNSESSYLTTQFASEVWYQLGDMTMAEHATLLSMIFSPANKGSRMIQRLAEINLINGDEAAATKYLCMLSKTMFYKQWAADRMPGVETLEVKQWLQQKRKFIPRSDTVRTSTMDAVKSLRLLLQSNPDNRMACDYLLCFHLLMKDLPSFILDYERFHKGSPNRLYSEALLITMARRRAAADEVKNTGMSPTVVQEFNEYTRLCDQSGKNPAAVAGRFGNTYWFYYHFAQFE
ncbi:DUF6057 family protein [Bacteroides sp.]